MMPKMPESLRLLKLLLYKNYLVRKRQWLMSLIGEVLIPVGILTCIWAVRGLNANAPVYVLNDTYYGMYSKEELINWITVEENQTVTMLYAPETEFTRGLMMRVKKCFGYRAELFGYDTEGELLTDYYKKIENDNDLIIPSIIFDPSSVDQSTTHLKYKIRSGMLAEMFRYSIFALHNITEYFTKENYFAQVQICLDESFIKMKSTKSFHPQIFVQQMPDPPHTKPDLFDSLFRQLFGVIFTLVFLIPLFIETAKASNEKFLGVNVLMSMNGVSNSLNLLSWLMSGVIFVIIGCILPIVWIIQCPIGDAVPYLHYSSAFIVFLVFTLYATQLFCYGIHVSAYFSRSLFVMFAILILNMVASTVHRHALNDDTVFLVPYFGVLFPNLLLVRAVEEINYYEIISDGVHWDNIFDVGNENYGAAGSVGGILLCSVVGIIVHFTMAAYVYAINPGKFGVPKHPLYFLKFQKRKINTDYRMDNLVTDNSDEVLFEPDSGANYQPGIQIRSLKKVYKIGVYKQTKVEALRGISVDFYKGQITALLGHNGAGKTTMMSILTGMRGPSDGIVLINSKDIKEHANEIMNDLGLCTQENMLFPGLTVGEQLEFFAMLKGKDKTKTDIQHNVTILLSKFKLQEKKDCLPNQLSGGQKRRVCLGMSLVGDSSTLILDEPTSGLDPENRRIIWDVLLKMRGEKTILISTHDMEEADILGDRIAILHGGQLKSCGTSLYLKKSIGQNNVEVTLSVEPSTDSGAILAELNDQAKITNQDGSKIVLSIPNTPQLPLMLDKLEDKKKELGITGLSASLISLEQVFLKVTQETNDLAKPRQPFYTTPFKLTGNELTMQATKALLSKKMTYTRKNMSTIFLKLLLIFVALLSISLVLKESNFSKILSKLIPISLKMYHKPITYYQSFDKTLGDQYASITRQFKGRYVEVKDSSVTDAMMVFADAEYSQYYNHLIAAAEFNKSSNGSLIVNAFYSEEASYSFPISVNLLMNTLAKAQLGNEYGISVSAQQLPALDLQVYKDISIVSAYTTAVLVAFFFCPAIALFVIHPLREFTSSVKQLQTMTGVSCLTYWGTMFLFDMVVYLIVIGLTLMGFAIMDYILELRIFMYNGMSIYFLLFLLFAINSLPFVYVFSFLNRDPSGLVRLLTYIPLGLVTVEIIMHTVRSELGKHAIVRTIRTIQKGIFLLVPYISFFHGQVSYHLTAQNNARCVKMPNEFYDTKCKPFPTDVCCLFGCRDGQCKSHIEFFNDFKYDISLEESLLYLGLTPFLYFGILVILEYKFVQNIRARMQKKTEPEYTDDEQVQRSKAAISAIINGLHETTTTNNNSEPIKEVITNGHNAVQDASGGHVLNNPTLFMVYELRKQYGNLSAVKDVSFSVHQKECFGLLGVNGAGKSTTFRMMTGGEVPDSGIMYVGDKDFRNNKQYFLSQMGYCPQHDALISSLNAYDHLTLFARLRGIPEMQVEMEVDTWIQRLNLTACASQPSGTYSGGNKRRLNIAIALIGIPNLVLLDEPTTGVDPGARHSLWNVIQSCQMTGQAVVLTSHSMEECEALCNRLAIMVGGRLVCIGPSQELKQRFGAGYDIQMKLNPEKARQQVETIKFEMKQALNCKLADENLGYLMYHVSPIGTSWSKMYGLMNGMKSKYDCIDDFAVLSSTLEQLFLLFARAANRDSTTMVDYE